jgi:preprotein translocase subunit SecE
MAMTGRKERVAPTARGGTRPRSGPGGGGGGAGTTETGRVGRLRGQVRDIAAELRKVTWPTREETRNLTIVVVGITVVIGTLLALVDTLFGYLYRLFNP